MSFRKALPLNVLMAYGLRFKIEVTFKSAVHAIGGFAYRFWTYALPRRGGLGATGTPIA